jgi:hypothetical protein
MEQEYKGFVIDADTKFTWKKNEISGANFLTAENSTTFGFKAITEETRNIYTPKTKGFRTIQAAKNEIDYRLKFPLVFEHSV